MDAHTHKNMRTFHLFNLRFVFLVHFFLFARSQKFSQRDDGVGYRNYLSDLINAKT